MILVPMTALGQLADQIVSPPVPAPLIPVPAVETPQQAAVRAKMEVVLAVYRMTASLHKAVAAAGMTLEGHRHWRRDRVLKNGEWTDQYNHPEYRAAWEQAKLELRDSVYSEGYIRAVRGVQEPMIVNGKFVMAVDEQGQLRPVLKRVVSDTLLGMYLKATRKEFQDSSRREREELAAPPTPATPAEVEELPAGDVDLRRLGDDEVRQLRALYAKASGEMDDTPMAAGITKA